ncbi:hypothetical protein A4A49_06664 [Nicotiana attenuata]|uniref:DUF7651 domain-containing protein n=1 Tax=Nicotiana attenuata TaxID=49451 RepID=A0A1J6JBC8_NICAT|nr:hypothetical protein A4A49_06664 [Nicotiana attenuata]
MTSCLDKDRHISFQYPRSSAALATIQQLQVKIAAEEAGTGEKSAYDSFSYDDIPTTSLPRIIRAIRKMLVYWHKYASTFGKSCNNWTLFLVNFFCIEDAGTGMLNNYCNSSYIS